MNDTNFTKSNSVESGLKAIDISNINVTMNDFIECIQNSDTYAKGTEGRKQYIDNSISRLYRIFVNMFAFEKILNGPTLDVASGWGILYPIFRKYLSNILPYHIAEMYDWEIRIDGDCIDGCKFECEKDTLKFEDYTFGTVCFFDCIEHLIIDPMWTLLEFNRVLKKGED
jgi:hypothetical protein